MASKLLSQVMPSTFSFLGGSVRSEMTMVRARVATKDHQLI
jgi:hypothetical protein